MRCIATAVLAVLVLSNTSSFAQGTPIGFPETFALAPDRAAVLDQLVPGTEDYYFYHCLHLQHARRFAEVGPLLEKWVERHGRGQRVVQIENRQAMLRFDEDPGAAYRLLRERLNLRFDDQREAPGEGPDLPTVLDPREVSWAAWAQRARAAHGGRFDAFGPVALRRAAAGQLSDAELRNLLERLERPDVANLAALVDRDLGNPRASTFGSFKVHRAMLREQLDALVQLRPSLINDAKFVEIYLARLAPTADENLERDTASRRAHLDRLQRFVDRLSSAHNSLKAHVLHHRLAFDLAQGELDRGRLLAYLRLPRQTDYANPDYLRQMRRREPMVQANSQFGTGFGPVGEDSDLVRTCLEHFFRTDDSFSAFAQFVEPGVLRRVFAETKILAGAGDMERWYSMLDDPSYYEQLERRVEIRFAPTQPKHFARDEQVSIGVDLKNVKTLLVKVFEIDSYDYQREKGREVDTALDLDGLVANHERTFTYDEPALRRVRREFAFPELRAPGIYIVEFIGNGLSSRALIEKGRLRYTERVGSAGHVLRVFDENGNRLRDAVAAVGNREFFADDAGEIVIPYSTSGGQKPLVLRHGRLSTLEKFQHREESYDLQAKAFVERESLIAGRIAKLLVRPSLDLHGERVDLGLLEDVTLTLTATNLDGVSTTQTVRGIELTQDAEVVHEFRVPDRLQRLHVSMIARVRQISRDRDVDLSAQAGTFEINQIDQTAETATFLVSKLADGRHIIDVRGRNGEPRPDHAVSIMLTHREFDVAHTVNLESDADGRVDLGALDGVAYAYVHHMPGATGSWVLAPTAHSGVEEVHGRVGEVLRVPYDGGATELSRDVVSMLEVRGGEFCRDVFDHASLRDGFVELQGLAAGDYDLRFGESNEHVRVRITDGKVDGGWVLGAHRALAIGPERSALQVTSAAVVGDDAVVQLANAGPGARVHVYATRYWPGFHALAALGLDLDKATASELALFGSVSEYREERLIGDEYRYILERRFAAKYPGNMLQRPGLILNPWALDETNTSIGLGGGAGGVRGGSRGGGRSRSSRAGEIGQGAGVSPSIGANLDFLPRGSQLVANLRPDANGRVSVPLASLGDGHLINVVALDDDDTVVTQVIRRERELQPAPRQLLAALPVERPVAEQRKIEFVPGGREAVFSDVTTSQFERFDSLAAVFAMFQSLTGHADLNEFAFLLEWPTLEAEAKRSLYSKHACHELHFFLHQKDRAFFDAEVRPYLSNKADKTFLDRWLLELDLSTYLEPWAFGRLNAVEKILLARRLPAHRAAIERLARETLEVRPPDPESQGALFANVLGSRELERSKDSGRPGRSAAEPPAAASPAPDPSDRKVAEVEEVLADEAPEEDAEGLADGVRLRRQLDADNKRRSEAGRFYRDPRTTQRLVEHNYWHLPIESQVADLIEFDEFWRDFAAAGGDAPFVSAHVAQAAGSFAEMILALSVLDLPFTAEEAALERVGDRLTIRSEGPQILVRKELLAATAAAESPVLLSQNVYRMDERYRYEGNERLDNFVTDEFLVHVVYGCQVALTNPTSSPRQLELLVQVPAGAIPVSRSLETQSQTVRLAPFATQTFESAFYFPATGEFACYPAQVSREDSVLARASTRVFRVVETPTTVDTSSWQHVSQNGTAAEVLAFVDDANLQRLDIGKVLWRLRDRPFFDALVGRLRERHAFRHDVWAYGVLHGDTAAARQWLENTPQWVEQCGPALESTLLSIDPVARHAYQHIELDPLFHARTHRFGGERRIYDEGLARQYLQLLDILCHRPQLDDADWMDVAYYLLLQDRVTDGLAAFDRVRPERLATRLQHDYMRAYLAFYTEDYGVARQIAAQHRDHPVSRWRSMFRDMIAQLDEAAGAAAAVADGENRDQAQGARAAEEPTLDVAVESREVTVRYENVDECTVSYYELDVEFSFSTAPFVQQGGSAFAYVRPNRRDVIALTADRAAVTFPLPAEFTNSNVLVEVTARGAAARRTYFANSLAIRTMDSFGQVKVAHADTGAPLSKVYVKCYARLPDGSIRFHKDGYTDLRGRFDYASLSNTETRTADRFALLVLSEDHGATIREVDPPTR